MLHSGFASVSFSLAPSLEHLASFALFWFGVCLSMRTNLLGFYAGILGLALLSLYVFKVTILCHFRNSQACELKVALDGIGALMPCSYGRQGVFCARAPCTLHVVPLALRSASCASCCLRMLHVVQFACATLHSSEIRLPSCNDALAHSPSRSNLRSCGLQFAVCALSFALCTLVHVLYHLEVPFLRVPYVGLFLRFAMYVLQVARCISARHALCVDPCAFHFKICVLRF